MYIFGAGVYIFFGTLFELFGLQAVTTHGLSISLPAPLSDINAAIALGCLSYLVILSGGIVANGLRGVGKTLKDFSLPISMSFRLFGALLSGLLVTELVYYYSSLSYVLPVVVCVIVYPAARADPNLRADDAYLPLLRRGIRGSYTKIPKKQTTNARTALKEKTEE